MPNLVLTKYEPKALAQSVIDQYMDGHKIHDIAVNLGLKGGEQIYRLLCKHAEEDWKEAQAAKALAEYEHAKDGLERAQDALSLARAREQVRVSQWELERVLRRIYGDAPPVQITVQVSDVRGRIIDLEQELHISSSAQPQAIDVKPLVPDCTSEQGE